MPDDPIPPESDPLNQLIWDQSLEGIAIPVMLFGPHPGETQSAPQAPPSAAEAKALDFLANRLGLVLSDVELYSADAYVLQCRYGQDVVDATLRERP